MRSTFAWPSRCGGVEVEKSRLSHAEDVLSCLRMTKWLSRLKVEGIHRSCDLDNVDVAKVSSWLDAV